MKWEYLKNLFFKGPLFEFAGMDSDSEQEDWSDDDDDSEQEDWVEPEHLSQLLSYCVLANPAAALHTPYSGPTPGTTLRAVGGRGLPYR